MNYGKNFFKSLRERNLTWLEKIPTPRHNIKFLGWVNSVHFVLYSIHTYILNSANNYCNEINLKLVQESCVKLIRKLKEEYRRRSPYIGYLVRSRQGLLASLHTLKSLTTRNAGF